MSRGSSTLELLGFSLYIAVMMIDLSGAIGRTGTEPVLGLLFPHLGNVSTAEGPGGA